MAYFIVEGDLTKFEVDCLVNAANTGLRMGGGVCGAIFSRAGSRKMEEACSKLSPIKTSEAVITPGFNLKASQVIHAAGPIYKDGLSGERELLKNTYLNSLNLAEKEGCKSIAFPLISSGIYGYPKAEALEVAREAIEEFLLEKDLLVYLVIFNRADFVPSISLKELDELLIRPQDELVYRKIMEPDLKVSSVEMELEGMLGKVGPGFKDYLFGLIDKRGLSDVEVYKRANLDRRHFSKIKNQDGYKPSKATVLALALAMELNLEETDGLLEEAGYALLPSSRLDIIIQYFIIKSVYDIHKVNEVLFYYGEKLLGL
ncbi:MAG: RNase III inhibitor [Tissierellia bacterium]|nr:RNase III inhibitor [Tissierellia bacterium]